MITSGIQPRYHSDNVTLYCADALKVMPQLHAKTIDMIFCDPPYGHNNNNNDMTHNREKFLTGKKIRYGNNHTGGDLISKRESVMGVSKKDEVHEARPILSDGAEATPLFRNMIKESVRLLGDGSACCCCCSGGGGVDIQLANWAIIMGDALEFIQVVVWDKGPMGMGWRYRRSYETVLVAIKPGAAMCWYDHSGKVENIIRNIRKIIPGKDNHPTEKPVQLCAHFIGIHSQPNDIILDPFAGTGSTGVAAVKMGRRFIGIELDPTFYETMEQRIRAVE